jgi:hypothetical protein
LCLKFSNIISSFYDTKKFLLVIEADFDLYLNGCDENKGKNTNPNSESNDNYKRINKNENYYGKNKMCLRSKYYKNLIEIDYIINKMKSKNFKK